MPDVNVTILDALDHEQLWRPWLKQSTSWEAWRSFLRVLFGLPLNDADLALFRECTGRTLPPQTAFQEAWLVCGRRAGKSVTLAFIAAYLAAFIDWSPYLVPGESAGIRIVAVDRRQAQVIFGYIRALLSGVPALAGEIARQDDDFIELKSGISIEVQTASFRSIRGYTIIALLADEIAFWRNEETAANPDTEILTAARAAQATLHGRGLLLTAGSPYAKRGEQYRTYRNHYGRDDSPVLVWRAATRTMNPSVPQEFIDEQLARDPEANAAEYLAEFRSDIGDFVPREVVDAAVVPDRRELPSVPGVDYVGAIDVSGGSVDSMTLAVAHAGPGSTVVLDAVREVRPPFSPEQVTQEFAELLRMYGISRIVGDRYGGLWPVEAFSRYGVSYKPADQSKSDFYRDLLPLLTSRKVELLDNPRLVNQIASLERRTARGGRDSIDHPPGAHDDLANAAAIALVRAALIAQPTLWRADALLQNGQAAPWPASAESIFATVAADETGCHWCLWGRDRSFGGAPLALIDYDRQPFSRDLIVALAARIISEATTAHAPSRMIYAQSALATEIIAIVTDAALAAISGASASLRDFNVAVRYDDIDELLRDRDALLLSGASAIGAGKCKMTITAVERSRTLPNPLAGLKPGAPASAAVDAALIGLAIAFAPKPERPLVRSSNSR